MDTPTLLAASLGLSTFALPIIMYLYTSGMKKDMKLLKSEIIAEYKDDIKILEDVVDNKIDKLIEDFGHKKLSVETLDLISKRLVKCIDKFDPNNKHGLYD